MTKQANYPNPTHAVEDVVFCADGEMAVIKRIRVLYDTVQYYGLMLTGPLSNSTNCAGELNQFLLDIDQFFPDTQ